MSTPFEAPERRPGGVYTEMVFDLDFLADLVSGGRSNLMGVMPARFRLKKTNKKTRERYIYSKLQISYLMKLNHSRNKGKKIRVDILSSHPVNINTDSTYRRIINFGNVLYLI